MPEYDDTNKGALFKNTDKDDDHPSWPDYNGNLKVECPHCNKVSDHWLDAWIKVGKKPGKLKGKSFMSLSLKPKTHTQRQSQPIENDFSDDIPF